MNQSEDSQGKLEEELAHALRRVDAPKGFAGRVLAAAVETTPRRAKVLAMPARVRMWTGGAIAAALLAGVFVQREVRAHERRQEALAQQQFEAAIRITGDTLDDVRRQLQHAGVELGD